MEINKDQKVSSRVWQGIKFAIKWLWLITMFLLGIILFVCLPLDIFEYSFSLSELDIVEELYLIWLMLFTYKYLKLCLIIKAPFMRKLITPFVYQAYFCLFSMACLIIARLAFDFPIDEIERMPLLKLLAYCLSMFTTVYSYQVLKNYLDTHMPEVTHSFNEAEC